MLELSDPTGGSNGPTSLVLRPPPVSDDDNWISAREAAVIIGVDRSRVFKFIHDGRLKAQRVPLGAGISNYYWRISRAEVARFAAIPRPPGGFHKR